MGGPLAHGGYPQPRDINDLVATIRKVRPACLHGVPTLFIALLNHPDVQSGKADIRSMKLCWSAAAPLMAETKQRFEKITGGWLLEAYAMTETILAAACCPIKGEYKPGSVGCPLPDVDMRIVDIDSGEEELPWARSARSSSMRRRSWPATGSVLPRRPT